MPAADRLTAPQVAELTGCQRSAVTKAIREGRLAASREETARGPVYWVARPDAEAYAAATRAWHLARAGKSLGGRTTHRPKPGPDQLPLAHPESAPPPVRPTAPVDDATPWRVDDALWARLEPLLAVEKPHAKTGRPRRGDRALFDGLIWLARTGAKWSELPGEFGSRSTANDRYREWLRAGAFEPAWALLQQERPDMRGLDLARPAGRGRGTAAAI